MAHHAAFSHASEPTKIIKRAQVSQIPSSGRDHPPPGAIRKKPVFAEPWQIDLLKDLHKQVANPSSEQKDLVAIQTGLDRRWITAWFGRINRAARKKGQVNLGTSDANATQRDPADQGLTPISSRLRARPPALTISQPAHSVHSLTLPGSSSSSSTYFAQDYSAALRSLPSPPHTSYLDHPFLMDHPGTAFDAWVSPPSSSSSNLDFGFPSPYRHESLSVFGALSPMFPSRFHPGAVLAASIEGSQAGPYGLSGCWSNDTSQPSPFTYTPSDLNPGSCSTSPLDLLLQRQVALLSPSTPLGSRAPPPNHPSISAIPTFQTQDHATQVHNLHVDMPTSAATSLHHRMVSFQPVFFQARYRDMVDLARRVREAYMLDQTGPLEKDGEKDVSPDQESQQEEGDKENYPPTYAHSLPGAESDDA